MKKILFALTAMLSAWQLHAAQVTMEIDNDWGQGFVAKVVIDNTNGTQAVSDWSVFFDLDSTISHLWNGAFTVDGQRVEVSNVGWNSEIPIGGRVEFGFQGSPGNISPVPVTLVTDTPPPPSPTPSPEPSPEPSPIPSPSPVVSPDPSPSPSPDVTPSPSPSPIVTPSPSPSPAPSAVACGVDPSGIPGDDDWLTTEGNQIVDKNGNSVWLTGANWFGFNASERVFHGIWSVNMENLVEGVAERGINLIRVPIGTELIKEWQSGVFEATNVNLFTNPNLTGKNSLEIFDHFLSVAKACGVKVMLDVHHPDQNNSGHHYWGWEKGDITVDDFYDTWEWITDRYKNDDTIIAMDLQNEPHGSPDGSEGNSLERGPDESWEEFCNRKPETDVTDFAKWDDSTDANNWRHVAQTAAERILAVNPNLLILVEGIEAYPRYGKWVNHKNTPVPSAQHECYDFNWWGGNLRGVRDFEVEVLGHQAQIMYSPHDYGPLVYLQPWFEEEFDRNSLRAEVWEPNWLYIHQDHISPLLIGEWGGFIDGGDNQRWMEALRDEIVELGLHHTFWAINPNSGDTGGLLMNDWLTWDEEKYDILEPALWQSHDGKFIGLDHEAKLGGTANTGLSLDDVF